MIKTIFTVTPSWLIKNKPDYKKGLAYLRKLGFDVRNSRILTKLDARTESD